MTTALSCSKCGAPLAPDSRAVRVQCAHCHTVVDVTSESVLRVADNLQKAGVRVSPNFMTQADIEEELARHQERRAEQGRTIVFITIVVFVLVAGVLMVALLGT